MWWYRKLDIKQALIQKNQFAFVLERPLEYSLNNKNKFEKNQVDHFIIEAVCLKEIECIQIGHDGTR